MVAASFLCGEWDKPSFATWAQSRPERLAPERPQGPQQHRSEVAHPLASLRSCGPGVPLTADLSHLLLRAGPHLSAAEAHRQPLLPPPGTMVSVQDFRKAPWDSDH